MKKLLAFAGFVLVSNVATAVPVYWDVAYYQDSGTETGFGHFSYDPDTMDQFHLFRYSSADVEAGFSMSTKISEFEWWDSGKLIATQDSFSPFWLPDPANGLNEAGRIGHIYSYGDVIDNGVWGSSSYLSPYHQIMYNFDIGEKQITGGWSYLNDYPDKFQGNFIASLRGSVPTVPIPATLPLLALGLVGLIYVGRRQNKAV